VQQADHFLADGTPGSRNAVASVPRNTCDLIMHWDLSWIAIGPIQGILQWYVWVIRKTRFTYR
jgi:hypothetical protein